MKRILIAIIFILYTVAIACVVTTPLVLSSLSTHGKAINAIVERQIQDEQTIQRLDSIINEYEKYN